jgi:hypothetical protein
MSVSQPNVIDRVELEKDTGHILLTVVDDLNWVDEDAHIAELQAKLNTYLAFIESGDIFARLREKLGHTVPHTSPIKIYVRARHPISELGKQFFAYAQSAFAEAKVALFFKLTSA